MIVGTVLVVLVLIIVFSTAGLLDSTTSTVVYIMVGVGVGFTALVLTIVVVIVCSRNHKEAVSNENGFTIQPGIINKSGTEAVRHAKAENTYSQSNEKKKCNEIVSPASTTSECQNRLRSGLERNFSISSDYTESHYYTEIDEYYINKRKEKQKKKLQFRYENEAFEEDEAIQENVIQFVNPPVNYDYAYNLNPTK